MGPSRGGVGDSGWTSLLHDRALSRAYDLDTIQVVAMFPAARGEINSRGEPTPMDSWNTEGAGGVTRSQERRSASACPWAQIGSVAPAGVPSRRDPLGDFRMHDVSDTFAAMENLPDLIAALPELGTGIILGAVIGILVGLYVDLKADNGIPFTWWQYGGIGGGVGALAWMALETL